MKRIAWKLANGSMLLTLITVTVYALAFAYDNETSSFYWFVLLWFATVFSWAVFYSYRPRDMGIDLKDLNYDCGFSWVSAPHQLQTPLSHRCNLKISEHEIRISGNWLYVKHKCEQCKEVHEWMCKPEMGIVDAIRNATVERSGY